MYIHIRPPPSPHPYPLAPVNKIGLGEAGFIQGLWGEDNMWIFDSYFKGCVELWSRDRGLEKISIAYPPSFYMHLKDPHDLFLS
jgi:hypothetical protein